MVEQNLKENKKIRIALFTDILEEDFDGASITLHKILRNVPKDRFEFLAITSHPPKNPDSIPFEIFTTRFIKWPFQKGYRLGVPGKEVEKKLQEFKPDLIHFTSPSLLGRKALKYGKANNIPVVNIYHTHYPAYLKYYMGKVGVFLFGGLVLRLVLWFYKKADLTLVPTSPIKKDLIKLGITKNKMKIWGRAISVGSFSPSYRDESFFDEDIPRKHKKVLFVSRLIKEKDMTTLVKVYKKLRKKNKKITMIVTGDGLRKKWLEKRMKHAVFTGKRVGEELAQIYASSDVFVFPSSTETFGNVVIEAMASGLPVVSANAGGPAEIVKNGKNGFLVESEKSKDFVKRIVQLLEDPKLYVKCSEAAVETIQSRSIESLHAQLWNIYEHTVANYQVTLTQQNEMIKNGKELDTVNSMKKHQLNTSVVDSL